MNIIMNEFTSEMQLRESFKCETLRDGKEQILIVHQGSQKVCIPFSSFVDELDLSKAKEISEMEYLNLLTLNPIDSKKNNYCFSK
jgi:tRNA threonylcarbamoyladenosine modification (KEOPS) complex Cgi121 subunit